jgi:hypothetical protein
MDDRRATLLAPNDASRGRTFVLSALAVTVASLPVPFVPREALTRVRGALAHDVAASAGLVLTTDARAVLAAAEPPSSSLVRSAVERVARRTLRGLVPVGGLVAAVRGLEVWALGHLFQRWIEVHRPKGSIRVHQDEAERVRTAIGQALVRALTPSVSARQVTQAPPVEDLRDEFTKSVDELLLAGAKLPGYLVRRLESAFDAALDAGQSGSGA